MTRKKKIALIVTGAVITTLALAALLVFLILRIVWTAVDKYELDDRTQTYIEAIIDCDDDKLYTVSYDRDVDAQELQEKLKEAGIFLRGEVTVDKVYSVNINIINKAEEVHAIFRVTIGSEHYRVTVEYVEDTGGSGIRSIFFKPV